LSWCITGSPARVRNLNKHAIKIRADPCFF
jgi:hypothetical protein